MKFRSLKADEIQCRVQSVKETGFSILLYKDARCDMEILDETVGALDWKREHTRDNANCIVSIWDAEKKEWVSKEDTGSESNTEKEKGLASDSFKRACFNWGIGRELYTAPFIWITAKQGEIKSSKGRDNKERHYVDYKVKMFVDHILIEDKKIVELRIIDQTGSKRFSYGIVDNDTKDWLSEADKEKWMKAEAWVKQGNNPHRLREKYKVNNNDMEYFETLFKEAGH